MRVLLTVLLIALPAALGCAAYRFPNPGITAASPPSTHPKLVLGVEEPEIRIDDEALAPAAGPDAHTSERRIQEAVRTIDALRGTGLFAEVDFVRQLSQPAEITIRIVPAPASTADADAVLPFIFTAGIFPLIHTEQTGVYFTRADRPAPPFHLDWPITAVAGWVAPFLLVLPDWRAERDPGLYHATLAAYLLGRRADLWDD